jgi:hypothetical protein
MAVAKNLRTARWHLIGSIFIIIIVAIVIVEGAPRPLRIVDY